MLTIDDVGEIPAALVKFLTLPNRGRSILSEVKPRLESRMREICQSGSEGGGTQTNESSLSLSCHHRYAVNEAVAFAVIAVNTNPEDALTRSG